MESKSALRTVLSSKSLSDKYQLPSSNQNESNDLVTSSEDLSNSWRRHSYHQQLDQPQFDNSSATILTIAAAVGTEERATSTIMPSSQQAATSTSDLDATIAGGVPRHIQDDVCVILSPSALCASSIESAPAAADPTVAPDGELICRICHSSETETIVARDLNSTEANNCNQLTSNPLISPCLCSGSLKYVHRDCLQYWVKSQDIEVCELCHFTFVMSVSTKPMREWRKLDMSAMERRKIICSVAFHVIALTCVVWSLYVLIEKTAMEVGSGKLEWSFWTKLVVVAIGFTGGIVFMYVQCRTYVSLCRRWRSFNRTFLIQSAAETDLEAARKRVKIEQQMIHRQQQQQPLPQLSLTV